MPILGRAAILCAPPPSTSLSACSVARLRGGDEGSGPQRLRCCGHFCFLPFFAPKSMLCTLWAHYRILHRIPGSAAFLLQPRCALAGYNLLAWPFAHLADCSLGMRGCGWGLWFAPLLLPRPPLSCNTTDPSFQRARPFDLGVSFKRRSGRTKLLPPGLGNRQKCGWPGVWG